MTDEAEKAMAMRYQALNSAQICGSGASSGIPVPKREKVALEQRIEMRLSGITRTLTALRGGGELADYDDEWDNDVSYALEFLTEAAAELTSLRSQNKEMRKALEPFAQMADWLPEDGPVARIRVTDEHDYAITGKDLHRAKAALLRALSNGSDNA